MAYFSIIETNGRKAILLHGLTQAERDRQDQDWSIEAWNHLLAELDLDSGLFTTLTFENVLEAEERDAHPEQWIIGDNVQAERIEELEAELARLELDHELTLRRDHETIVSLRDKLSGEETAHGETRDELEDRLRVYEQTRDALGRRLSFFDLSYEYAKQAQTIRDLQAQNLSNDHDRVAFLEAKVQGLEGRLVGLADIEDGQDLAQRYRAQVGTIQRLQREASEYRQRIENQRDKLQAQRAEHDATVAELRRRNENQKNTIDQVDAALEAKEEELRSYVASSKKQAETITEYQRRTKQFADGTPIGETVFAEPKS